MRPIMKVTAICHRNNPVFRGCLLGKPTTEDHTLYSVASAASALRLYETRGPEGVVAIHCPPEGDSIASAIVAMKPRYVGHSRNVGRTLLSSAEGKCVKYVVVVDDDIDPFDLGQVWWAIICAAVQYSVFRFVSVIRAGACPLERMAAVRIVALKSMSNAPSARSAASCK